MANASASTTIDQTATNYFYGMFYVGDGQRLAHWVEIMLRPMRYTPGRIWN